MISGKFHLNLDEQLAMAVFGQVQEVKSEARTIVCSAQSPLVSITNTGCELNSKRFQTKSPEGGGTVASMAEDTYELRLEQEGFHIIPVQGGEVVKTIFYSSIKQSARLTYKEELEGRLQSSCCHKEPALRGWG